MKKWRQTQKNYEENILHYDIDQAIVDDNANALIYKKHPLSGRILDIGGGHGFLRKFLSDGTEYICIDPWTDAQNHAYKLTHNQKLYELFPFLHEPFCFIVGYGEKLPFADNTFDWVHIRSVLDHTADPACVLLESKRVLKPNGSLLLNLHLKDGPKVTQKNQPSLYKRALRCLQKEGISRFLKKTIYTIRGTDIDHMFHPSLAEIEKLMDTAKLSIIDQEWISNSTGIQGDFLLISKKPID